jgi:hypothetical protein
MKKKKYQVILIQKHSIIKKEHQLSPILIRYSKKLHSNSKLILKWEIKILFKNRRVEVEPKKITSLRI